MKNRTVKQGNQQYLVHTRFYAFDITVKGVRHHGIKEDVCAGNVMLWLLKKMPGCKGKVMQHENQKDLKTTEYFDLNGDVVNEQRSSA